MRIHKDHFERVRHTLAASVVALLAAAPTLVEAAQPAAYVPTMADYQGVYDALQNYRLGVEKHDQKAAEKAFWPDGVNIAVPTPGGPEIRLPLKEGGPPPAGGGQPGSGGGPPPGFGPPPGAGQPGPNAGPPPGFGPPPGAGAGQPGPNAGPPPGAGGGGGGEVWHLPLDSYIHFESATRATHYEYFLSIYPQPEKKGEAGGVGFQNSRTSIVGWPGHYADILEKRNGEWRILSRKSMINQK